MQLSSNFLQVKRVVWPGMMALLPLVWRSLTWYLTTRCTGSSPLGIAFSLPSDARCVELLSQTVFRISVAIEKRARSVFQTRIQGLSTSDCKTEASRRNVLADP